MLQKKPVIVTNADSLIDIVEKYDCGYSYRDTDTSELVEAITKLNDKTHRNKLGLNGYNAIHKYCNWEHDKSTLLSAVSELENITKQK